MTRVGCLILAVFCVFLPAQAPHPLAIESADSRQYDFLDPLLKGTEVVSLAESIHITREFPEVRLGAIRWMHQHLGYSVLAFEGSPEDIWVSQDALLHASSDIAEPTGGLFSIWQTDETREVFDYERNTWSTAHPLYITAYDIQPGTGRETNGSRVFTLLRQHLAQYASIPAEINSTEWVAALAPLTYGCGEYKPSDDPRITQAIGVLEQWIAVAAPKVENMYPAMPMHTQALRLIPANLRASLALCQGITSRKGNKRDWGKYKRTRDTYAAQYALALKAVSPQQKLLLWAHASHLFYDSTGRNTSVGELLHRALGPRLYTVGTFALGGGTIVFYSDVSEDFGYTPISGVSSAIRTLLAHHCPTACFTDLRQLPLGSPLMNQQKVWVESRTGPMALASDFDGVIWIRRVHPPHLHLKPVVMLYLMTKHYLVPGAILLGLLLAALVSVKLRGSFRTRSVL